MTVSQLIKDAAPMADFSLPASATPEDVTIPTFQVTRPRGFLPRQNPLVTLPDEFSALEDILQRMSLKTTLGKPGLLATNTLGTTIDESFPNLLTSITPYSENHHILSALYRDYSFLASAYLLEPCHHEYVRSKSEGYGLARARLPANIAQPIAAVAKLLGVLPFMEYAGSYALANWALVDESKDIEYDNLRLIRAFEGGESEKGFVLVHVDMVRHSGGLVGGAYDALRGVEAGDREVANDGLRGALTALKLVNIAMERMWNRSKPGEYGLFRTFIFGITSQSMFPDGVIYEGVGDNGEDVNMSFRGESGANDSMVPLMDNLLQVPMPSTPLTTILTDFRRYRPGDHRSFLEWVNHTSSLLGTRSWCMKSRDSAALYLALADGIREFRWRHWCFTREYIIKKTKHPTATGGSPIVRWLPNQLFAVLGLEREVIKVIEGMDEGLGEEQRGIKETVERQWEGLTREVRRFCDERGERVEIPGAEMKVEGAEVEVKG